MPVLSPHRSSASGLSGSYRSTFNSSALDRPYYSSSSYNPRITSYSERYTTRSYTDADGRRIYSRSGSITEDGVTTRFREESRESSARRDSIGRDSGISSIRENSIMDYPRRDSSQSRLSTANIIDSVAELRNKYSPANYVPACLRKNENISRSKSINDIGLPPVEAKTINKKKVTDRGDAVFSTTNSVLNSNNTNNTDNLTDEDDNGNRASVADLCKKFDEKTPKIVVKNGLTPAARTAEGKSNSKLEVNEETDVKNGSDVEREKERDDIANGTSSRNGSRVNNFASYISTKDYQKGDETKGDCLKENAKNDMDGKDNYTGKIIQNVNYFIVFVWSLLLASVLYGFVTGVLDNYTTRRSCGYHEDCVRFYCLTSPLRRSSPATPSPPSSSIPSSLNSLSRRSSDRDSYRTHRDLDDDSSGERSTIRSTAPTKVLGLNGLKNIGNTCFMNSVIQCLSNTRWLLEYLRKDAYMRDINTTISGMKGALIKAFAEVIKELWSEDSLDRVVNTVSLKSQIQRFAPRFMGYAQQDAQEFLRYLLEGLHEDVNRVTEKPKPILTEIDEKLSDHEKAQESWQRYLRMDNSKIVDHFVGQLKSTLKCTYCGHCSVTFDPFWDLSLPIPQRTGQLRLSQCLDSFTREETLDGDEKPTCSKCKERRKCTKSFSIQKFPKILVIHLKRFSPTERFRGKLNVTVDFPIEGLDMSNYAADNIAPCRYNLYAISNHSGTTYSGHYTAYCRHPYAGTWHEYNDSRVTSISPKSLVSGEAYVLFYEQEGAKSHL
ncbi:hypothetical protein NQ315_002389 [Exocentrus adspersus]|uniref:Ubiquitin carboxyl-terminal hydrolase n=1 Tax=Exocentrus adspersus TaxID=1586481 RepID=A0AAV8VTD6_9CUCU|nr:hypothetical protein NQ315_002389 [Exocentrus adspersus]